MGLYCLKIQYTPEAIGSIVKSGSNREEVVRQTVASVGGKLHGFYGIFGDPDGFHAMIIAETPSNTEYLATVLTAAMGGALAKWRTHVLYTANDMVAAAEMVNNSKVEYEAPGS